MGIDSVKSSCRTCDVRILHTWQCYKIYGGNKCPSYNKYQPKVGDPFYRYEESRRSSGVDDFGDALPGYHVCVNLFRYEVTKVTPKGCWVCPFILGRVWKGAPIFILNYALKKCACPSKAAASESFLFRKQAQLRILEEQVRYVKRAVSVFKGDHIV